LSKGFCDVAKVVCPENNLATLSNFGYILDMKVEKSRILLDSWLPAGTYHKNLANLGHFFHENPFI
jgi:hypothetical protein